MVQRSLMTDETPTLIVRTGGNIQVEGWDEQRVLVEADNQWGLKIQHKQGAIEVNFGGDGTLHIPVGSNLKVYSNREARITHITGVVTIYAGSDVLVEDVNAIAQASSGGQMTIDCETVFGNDIGLTATGDIRCRVRTLVNATLKVNDMGNYWEGKMGSGATTLQIKSGGAVTIITDQEIIAQPPYHVLGQIEKPPVA